MSNLPTFIISLLAYVICVRVSLAIAGQKIRLALFFLFNISFFVWLSLQTRFNQWETGVILDLGYPAVSRHIALVAFYVVLVAAGYVLLKYLAMREGWLPWVAFFYPISILVVFKYFAFLWSPLISMLDWDGWVLNSTLIGLSYMAFRLSYLVLEVRNGTAEMPGLSEYLGFAFFLPTMVVGPINPFSNHQKSLRDSGETMSQTGRCLIRIIVGSTKFLFLANLANRLSYNGIFLDGKPHGIEDLFIAAVFYYLFLYLNFSGICDIAIGIAGLIGIRVNENFDNPFAARNIKEFWNRWHITLSAYTRDVIFAPLSKGLIKKFGTKYTNFSISVSIFVVFLVIGIWHGVGWQFAVFGIIHAVGVIANHYYSIWLKRVLGKESYRKYNNSKLVNAAAMVLTFCYVAFSFFFFANTRNMMGTIYHALRNGLSV